MTEHTLPPQIPYERRRITMDDGVSLAVQVVGQGPVVLIGNGIGVTSPGLDLLVDHVRTRHRVVTWDYRGIGGSRLLHRDEELTVQRHAADALQVLDALGEPRAAVLGWSLGVAVGLEIIRSAPERVVAYGALFGAPGQPFRAAFPEPVAALVHLAVALACDVPHAAQGLLRLGVAVPELAWWICTRIGFCNPSSDRHLFEEHVRSTADADKWAYFRTMWEMMHHDARDLLGAIRCPVVVVAGEDDWVTPPAAARELAQGIPGARLVVLPRTSHFGIIEHGPELWTHVDQLLVDAGWAARPRRRRRRAA
jgi:pimeloyl-ACP methyl ester carboxylesterase